MQYGSGGYGPDGRERFPQPEILPPLPENEPARPYEHAWRVPPPPPPRPEPPRKSRSFPITYALVAMNAGVFLVMALSGVNVLAPSANELIRWGAMAGWLVIGRDEWWRLLTSTFIHVGIIHLATNMYCLWNLGLLAEPLLGPAGLMAVYCLTGIGGNLLGLAVHPNVPGAGASGAVFGIAGVLIVLLKSAHLPMPEFELKRLRRSVMYFAGINLMIGLITWVAQTAIQVDNMAHFGGFLSGLALAAPLAPQVMKGRERYLRAQAVIFCVTFVLFAAIGFGIYRMYT